jgi:hypothetical protein
MSDRRKREIRKLMAETGMNYTRAARELERAKSADAPSAADSIKAGPAFAEISRAAQEHARQAARIGDLGLAGRQIAEISRAAQEHARQIAEIRRQAERANVFRVRFTPPV